MGLILIDLEKILLMKPSEFEIPFQSKIMIKKLLKNCRNIYVVEKRIVSKLLKILITNINSTNWRLEARLCQNVTSLEISEKIVSTFLYSQFWTLYIYLKQTALLKTLSIILNVWKLNILNASKKKVFQNQWYVNQCNICDT